MNQQKRINKILDAVETRIQTEFASLLGADFTLGGGERKLVSKQDAFDSLQGKQISAQMDITGKISGRSCLLIGIKDAILLAGTLIMLPAAELKEAVSREEYSDEIEDSYGEIANIIADSFTKDFEELYPESCRFVRTQQEILTPAKIDIDTDTPIANGMYYQMSSSMALDGKQMGNLVMLLPAAAFELSDEQEIEESADESMDSGFADEAVDPAEMLPPDGQREEGTASIKEQQSSPVRASKQEVKKQKQRVDKVLAACRNRMADDIGALLGTEVKLSNLENLIVSKEEFFFDEVTGKQVIANMDVVGEFVGKSYLTVGLRDAIRIGGTLIMLPASELDSVAAAEDFGEDTQDAFGEIANIIAGVYTAVFEKLYSKPFRFVKTDLQQVAPMKVDIAAVEPFPDQDYYLSRMDLALGTHGLGKIQILFPAELLHLSELRAGDAGAGSGADVSADAAVGIEPIGSDQSQSRQAVRDDLGTLDILVIGDDDAEADKIAAVLGKSGYTVKILSFKDNLHSYIPGKLKAIYLVMQEVNEQAFGVAIKVSSACSVPLIAAGPGWTKTKVIKAVKYGVRDILLTPASEDDIRENIASHLLEMAA